MAGKIHGLYVHSRCHMRSPTWAIITPDGKIVIVCAECEKVVGTFELKNPPKLGCSDPECGGHG